MRSVLRNAQNVLAIELMVAAQALDWRLGMAVDPIAPRKPLSMEEAEEQARAFARVDPARVAEEIAPGLRMFYVAVREVSPPITRDRPISEDIRAVRERMKDDG